MTTQTFTNAAGGSWETTANWTPAGNPGALVNDALINVPGTYTVTIAAVEAPNSITLNDALATLLIASTGQVLGGPVALNAGTLALNAGGIIAGSVITNNGGTFAPTGGTLDSVTWQGAMGGLSGAATYSVAIKDGITLQNAAGTAPGTLDLASLDTLNVLNSTPLDDLTVNFDALNSVDLIGPGSAALVLGPNAFLNQSAANASGFVQGGTLTNNGTVSATGSGSTLAIQDTLFNNAGTLVAGDGDAVSVSAGFSNTGTVGISGAGTLTLGTTSNSLLSNNGTISIASAGTFVADGSLAGSGVLTLASFGVADMYNTGNTTIFLDGRGEMVMEEPMTFTGTIAGFQHGDKIDLVATPVTNVSYTPDPAQPSNGGVLTLKNGTTVEAALNLEGNYTELTFGYMTDGTGNDVTVGCFAAGANILTTTGEIPVEALREGDLLPVHSRPEPMAIVWIGRRHVNCLRHPNPAGVCPVRVAAHAVAPGQPRRELYLSPDHAVFVDGVLIPIRHLINGTTIRQVPKDEVAYYHIELEQHDVLLADGLPCESYLDRGDRRDFGNVGEAIAPHPDFSSMPRDVAMMWEARGYAPLVVTGPRLDAVRRRLRAGDLPTRQVA